MIFEEPLPFTEAAEILAEKGLLPTNLGSDGIRQWDARLRARSIFSARTTKLEPLQRVKDLLGKLLEGETDMATARAELQDEYDRLDYDPQRGFGDDPAIPPAERGSQRDLSSDKRTQLVLETNMRQVAARAYRDAGQSDFALYAWPCYELLRIYPRRVPRGEKIVKGETVDDPGNDWPARWEQVGGEFYDGRMIARKDSDVWAELGSSANFPDALDTDHEPFAFGSGYGRREVPREECVALGVIDEETDIEGRSSERTEALEIAADFDPEFLALLKADLDVAVENGRARLAINDGTSEGAEKGWATRRGGGWSPKSKEYRRKLAEGRDAMERVIRQKRDVLGAVEHPALGKIDFRYGKAGSAPDFKGGSGVAHIIAKRDYEAQTDSRMKGLTGKHVARAMAETILRGKVGGPYEGGSKRDVEWKNFKATLSRNFAGAGNPWLLTGFVKREAR